MASSPPKSPPRSPLSVLRSPPAPEGPKESAVSRLLIAPLTFISFLISLALIDSRNHNLRTHSHTSPRPQPDSFLGRTKNFFHALVFKPTSTSSPYAYVTSPVLKPTDGKVGEKLSGAREKTNEPWHWHTKQRMMMKAEVSDAFKIRKWVLVILAAGGVMGAFGAIVFVRWLVYLWKSRRILVL